MRIAYFTFGDQPNFGKELGLARVTRDPDGEPGKEGVLVHVCNGKDNVMVLLEDHELRGYRVRT